MEFAPELRRRVFVDRRERVTANVAAPVYGTGLLPLPLPFPVPASTPAGARASIFAKDDILSVSITVT